MALTRSGLRLTIWNGKHALPEIICDTSPFQYLYQVGRLDLLPRLFSEVVVPSAVSAELAQGRRLGVDVPQPEVLPWVEIREPHSEVSYL